jgi:hypothetical protein
MALLQSKLRELSSFYASTIAGKFEAVRQNNAIITREIMAITDEEEMQRTQGMPLTDTEKRLLGEFEQWKFDLDRPGSEWKRIRELAQKARRRNRDGERARMQLDQETLKSLVQVLKTNEDALEALQMETKKMQKAADEWGAEFERL